ncbi:MAG: amidohydrolase family protein [Burkholderiaceae bacterium]
MQSDIAATAGSFALVHCSVLTMVGETTLTDHTVVVRGRRIESVGPSAQLQVPPDAIWLDATGWTVMPGLCDMHVHLLPVDVGTEHGAPDEESAMRRAAEYLESLLDNGVTMVRNMAGTPLHLRIRDAVRSGRLLGPRIYTAGPILETRFTFPGLAMFGQLVRSREEARAAVLEHERAGYDCIKVYNDLDADIYDEIIATAREQGMQVVGHVAFSKGLAGALAAKQDSIEHFRSYDFALDTRPEAGPERFVGWLHTTPARMRELAERTAEAGVWNVPTVVVETAIAHAAIEGNPSSPGDAGDVAVPDWIDPTLDVAGVKNAFSLAQLQAIRSGMDGRLEMVSAFERAGARLLAGSDCPSCGLMPGRSLHKELALFVEAGLSPMRALRTATLDAAQFLGLDKDLGTVEAGKLADLLVLRGDPAVDILQLSRQVGVVVDGAWVAAPSFFPPTQDSS